MRASKTERLLCGCQDPDCFDPVFVPKGLRLRLSRVTEACVCVRGHKPPPDMVRVTDEDEEFPVGPYDIYCLPGQHLPPSRRLQPKSQSYLPPKSPPKPNHARGFCHPVEVVDPRPDEPPNNDRRVPRHPEKRD